MKRKIALISDGAFELADPERGHVERQRACVWGVARSLSRIGYQVDVFACKDRESGTELEERLENVRVIHVPREASVSRRVHRESLPNAMHEFTGCVLSLCSRQGKPYDLIHAVSWGSGWAAVEIKAASGIPFVITFPGRDEEGRPWQRDENSFPATCSEVEDRIIRNADGIIARSPHDREELISLYQADPSYIAQIPSDGVAQPDGPDESQPETWQRFTSLLVELYESVLAVRRVAVPQMDRADLVMGQRDDHGRSQIVHRAFETAIQALREARADLEEQILRAASLMIECLHRGGKIMVCGAGAADGDARYFSAELMGRSLLSGHTGLPVLLLAADVRSSAYPANETDHETVFSRQVEALGRPGDLLFGVAREDDLECLAQAFRSARLHNLKCMGLMGWTAAYLASLANVALVVRSTNARQTRRVQMLILDLLCDLVEEQLMGAHRIPADNFYDTGGALNLLERLVE